VKYLVPKDFHHRIAFSLIERRRLLLKAIAANSFLPDNVRLSATQGLHKLRKYGLPSKIRNRCLLSGRANAVYRPFRLARSMLYEQASFGRLSGVKRSSW